MILAHGLIYINTYIHEYTYIRNGVRCDEAYVIIYIQTCTHTYIHTVYDGVKLISQYICIYTQMHTYNEYAEFLSILDMHLQAARTLLNVSLA